MGLMDCTYLMSLIFFLTSHKATAKDDIEEAIDAYTRKDYVQLGIKLIEIKFSIDPPEQYSTEQLQLLIARHVLVKVHPYYLYWFPNKTPAENSTSFTNETDSSSGSSTLPKSFNQVLNLLDYGTDQISTGINNLLGLGVKVIKNMAQIPQPNTMEKGEGEKVENSMDNNLDTQEDVTANPHKQSKEHSSSENLGEGSGGSNLLSDTVSFLTNAAIQTADDVIGALTSNDLHTSVDKKKEKSKSEFDGSITDQSLKLNHSDAKENNGQKVKKKVTNEKQFHQKPSSSKNKSNTKLKNNTNSKKSDNLKNGTNKINCNKNEGKSSNCTISKQQNTNKTNAKITTRKSTTSNHRKKQNNS